MADRSKYQRAARGDIAYNMMRMWRGAVGIAPADGLVSPAYVVARPFAETNEIPDKVAANPAYQNAKQELFKQFSDNPEFKRWLADTIFSMTFDGPTQSSP